MDRTKPVGLGLVGCGSFGQFCLRAFRQMQQVRIVAGADSYASNAEHCAEEFGIPVYQTAAELVADRNVEIVHVATPPSIHREIALQCFAAGKHVLCEKPLALTVKQADEILAAAGQAGCIVPVNYVLRYNPVTEAVKRIIDSQLLGRPLYACLTNLATDSHLPPGHWFWDKSTSGGIFVEHGVHFFDLYRYWLGPGEVVWSSALERGQTHQEDRVDCIVLHEGGLLASHHHEFDQLGPMDRTDHRIIFEMGEIAVNGWIPLTLSVDAAADSETAARLKEMCGKTSLQSVQDFTPEQRGMTSRGKRREATMRIHLEYTPQADKTAAYTQSVRDLLADQLAYLQDRERRRVVTEVNGRDAVAMAQRAADLAAGKEFIHAAA